MNTQFVFYVSHVNATLALVVDKHRESTPIFSALFRACKNEVDVRVAVGDKAFYAIKQPATIFLRVGGFEHNALQVATSIRFGKVHRHCFAFANAGNVFLTLLFVAKFVKCLDTILQAPDVLEARIGRGHHLGSH